MSEKRHRVRLLWALALGAAGLGAWYGREQLQPQRVAGAAPPVANRPSPANAGALGRFVPENGLLQIAAPYYQSRPSVVTHLAIREGQLLKRGQLIAVLDGKSQVEAERVRAAAEVELARRRLEQVRAGTRSTEQEAQRAELQRLEAAHRLEQLQLARHESLYEARVIAAAALDASRAAEQASRRAADAARQRLSTLMQVRDEDLRVAESELAVAEARLKETDTRLAALTVTAPADGVVVRIHARAGEQCGPAGILEMADTTNMSVEAEVYATDLAAVRVGQRAVIEPEDGGPKMAGQVIRIGTQVRQATVMPGDPVAYNEARVVPVRISVPACADAPCPINARLRVLLETAR